MDGLRRKRENDAGEETGEFARCGPIEVGGGGPDDLAADRAPGALPGPGWPCLWRRKVANPAPGAGSALSTAVAQMLVVGDDARHVGG